MRIASRLWTLTLALVAGCATAEGPVTEYLDPQTAMTVRAVATPFLYAREVPELAANARDYLSLGAVEVNNMGTRKHYLVLVYWSTVDRREAGRRLAAPDHVEFELGGKVRALDAAGHEGRSLGVSEPQFHPRSGYVGESWFAVTPADLRTFRDAPPPTISTDSAAGRLVFTSWRPAAAPLDAFVRDIPASPGGTPR